MPAAGLDLQADQNRRFYDSYWSGDFAARQQLWREWWQEAYAQALAFAGPLPGKKVLNLFAGHGADARWLQGLGAEVVALDFSRGGLVHLTGDRTAPAPLCADATRIPCADATFDLVFVINGICHTDKGRVLAECRRVLKPGGTTVLIEVLRWPHVALLARLLDPFFWKAPHRFLSVGELERLGRDYGTCEHREFCFLSVCSIMLRRLLPASRLLQRLHAACMALDRWLLRALPCLRRCCYLTVAKLV